jgi:hypothetical protein
MVRGRDKTLRLCRDDNNQAEQDISDRLNRVTNLLCAVMTKFEPYIKKFKAHLSDQDYVDLMDWWQATKRWIREELSVKSLIRLNKSYKENTK